MKNIALLLIATAVAALNPGVPLHAADLSGHKLLVTSVRTGDTEVFVADPNTGDMFNVTRSPQSEDRYPCWSPDARQICFMSDREGTTNLWICDADGANVHRLNRTPAVCYMPSWQQTPGGERIVFGKHGEKPEMAMIKPDGTGEQILGEGHDPTLSPDGRRITYTGHAGGGVTVFVMNHDGTDKRQIVPAISTVGATFPNWSPDSRQIVYSFPVGDALELFVVNADGSDNHQLTRFGGQSVCTPSAWSPDGRWISFRRTDERYWSNPVRMRQVYAEKPADKRPVWVIRPDGTEATLVEPLHYQMAIDGSRASWRPGVELSSIGRVSQAAVTGRTATSGTSSAAEQSSALPVMSILDEFTSPNVPAHGPEELPGDPPRWLVATHETDPTYPGGGLGRHPMLYIGEGCNTMFLVNKGKVIWTYSTGTGWEYDDIWLLSNGNILFSRMGWAGEVTPQKKLVWRMDAPKGTEIHTVQPIGLDRVLLMQNGKPPKLIIVSKKTGKIEVEHAMPDDGKGVHAQFRRLRMTAQGTYLVPFLQLHKVVEYDQDFKEIWSYSIKTPWAAIRLHNGNTLITDEGEKLTREVTPKGDTVWELKLSELPPEFRLADSQSCVRLANGNTILCSRGDGGKSPQLVEVTPDKKVVWVINDWKNFGPATAIQILDDPGIPEHPGDLQR